MVKFIQILIVSIITSVTLQAQQKLYVALDGDDTSLGTIAEPFASIERARDEIREIKTTTGLPSGGIEVILRGGTYAIMDGFELSSEDSGNLE